MMRTFISFEWKRFWSDIKNKVAFLLFIGLSLYMVFGVERTFEPVRSFDPDPITATYQDADYFLETREPEKYERSFLMFGNLRSLAKDLLDALDQKDYREAIVLEDEYHNAMNARYEGENPRYYLYGEDFSGRMQLQAYDQSSYFLYSQALLESDLYLTPEILEGKTIRQSLARGWLGAMPLILLIVGLIFSIDFFASDSNHQTLAGALPFSAYKKSWLRTFIVWVSTVLTLLVGEILFVLALSFFRDWGGIDLWVPGILKQISVLVFLVQSHLLLFLALLIVLRIASWTGQLFKSSVVSVLLIPTLIIPYLFEIGRQTGFAKYFEWFPLFSFIQPGNIVSGFQNFWYASTQFTFEREVFLLLIGFLLVEVLIYSTIKKFSFGNQIQKNERRGVMK